jgi:cytochrome c biogenesis protein CcmG/thiol:disulfide interchange protein DsbE
MSTTTRSGQVSPSIWDHRRTWYGLMALTLILSVAWLLASRIQGTADPKTLVPAPQAGFLAPDFTLTTLEGETVTLSVLRGRAVLINFWATWCPPCRTELPTIQSAYDRYADQGLVVLAVDMAEPPQVVAAFAQKFALRFPILLDHDGEVAAQYQIRALPTSFFVDREGVIRSMFIGPMNGPLMDERLAQILGEGV